MQNASALQDRVAAAPAAVVDPFDALLEDDVLPSRMPDVRLLRDYARSGSPHGEPLCLSFGETWNQVDPRLARLLGEAPLHAHGYQLSMYGLPALRQQLRRHVGLSQRLEDVGRAGVDYEVAVSWSGTRSAMADFGRLLLSERSDGRRPVVISTAPSWDYTGVFGPLGFELEYLYLRPESGFRPSPEELEALVARIAADPSRRLALVVINAQHNPTGVNFPEPFVRSSVRLALGQGAALLLDDAYFAVHNPYVRPTSAVRVLLEELAADPSAKARCRWLGVRSLGKQFNCNGWGLGALLSSPATLERLVNEIRLSHTLMYAGAPQHAMARWLSHPASEAYLEERRLQYADKRLLVGRILRDELNYPASAVHLGECTSYLMLEVPPAYAELEEGVARFRDDLFARTGVLLAPGWPWPFAARAPFPLPYVRMFIGPSRDRLHRALRRMRAAGFDYGMQVLPG